LFYHIVWATKGRQPLIGDEEEAIIRRSLKLTFDDLDVIPHAVSIMPDHVHVVVSAPPKISPAELVKRMKGASSHAIREEVDRWFAWQAEYGVHSFSEQALPKVVAYVANQHVHHAANTLWAGLERSTNAPGRSTSRRLQPTSVTEPGN
jgi:putative transposase